MINLIEKYNEFQFVYVVPKYLSILDSEMFVGASYSSLQDKELDKFQLTNHQRGLYNRRHSESITESFYGVIVKMSRHNKRVVYIIESINRLSIIAEKGQYTEKEVYLLKEGELV